MKKIPSLIFMVGALAIVCGGVWVWMVIMTAIAGNYGPGFALAFVLASGFAAITYWDIIALPWRAWAALCIDIDRRI